MIKKILTHLTSLFAIALFFMVLFGMGATPTFADDGPQATVRIYEEDLGFEIPDLADLLTFVIRIFFVIAGLVALLYLLLGAFSWITSGGDEDNVKKAREKITAAIIGVVLIVAVLAVIVTLEQVVFRKEICFGISCPATIPNLVRSCDDEGVDCTTRP